MTSADRPPSPSPAPTPSVARQELAVGVIAASCILALLFFARVVLVPIALAVILSLAIAPLVRLLRRTGLNALGAVLAAAAGLSIVLVGLAAVIVVQVGHVAAELPRYEATLFAKARAAEAFVTERLRLPGLAAPVSTTLPAVGEATAGNRTTLTVVSTTLKSIWLPLQTAGIVLVLLLFVLLEHEAMRDRLIRLAGVTDLRATTAAFNDAGERLSRFFVSQFAVNVAVGVLVGLGLAAMGFPHATLWAVLTAVLRFVPYVGVLAAALSALVLAAAIDPGWSLVFLTLGLFVLVEVVATQLVEPQLYGHTAGMSPLSVIVSAMFWGWLWGPVGLVVSTPITLCLVVAGHHVRALGFLHILLGDAPALTMPQRFYQRALSGDSDEIIAGARLFLKRRSFAAYCDTVLMPALRLLRRDVAIGQITPTQLANVRSSSIEVINVLGREAGKRRRRHRRNSVLDDPNPGRHLRHMREEESGRWQGPLAAPAGSVVICVGLGSIGDELATELLVRILRDLSIDARHLSIEELSEPMPEGGSPDAVSMTCIVSIAPDDELATGTAVAAQVQQRFQGHSRVVALLFRETTIERLPEAGLDAFDVVTASFEETAQLALRCVSPPEPLASARAP